MEAPLKFTAPNIDLPLGLGIGHVVFHALNKVEIGLCLAGLVTFIIAKPKTKTAVSIFGAIALILLLQTFWLFPILDERTMKVISGDAEPFSNLHIVYIVFDSLKIVLLFSLGVILLRQNLKED
ncbi:MAG: hypothetical protein HKN25_17575 [Pyrinomonadaceae bacterium]|nr:hypothetical protein [Pyrinomonadaceae bacterium]